MFFGGELGGGLESISFYRNNKGSNTFEFCNMDFFFTTNKQGPGKQNFVQKKTKCGITFKKPKVIKFVKKNFLKLF